MGGGGGEGAGVCRVASVNSLLEFPIILVMCDSQVLNNCGPVNLTETV